MAGADFTIAEFLAWARTKPADEAYDFCDATSCAVAQFGLETGRKNLVGLRSFELRDLGVLNAVHPTSRTEEWTFGALVKRLEALLPETVVAPSEWVAINAYLTDIDATAADVVRERTA